MRLNLLVQDLAYRYNVSTSVISKAFHEVIDLLYVNLKQMIHWPAREDLVVSMPMAFREKFGTKVAAIVDCFEIVIERPSNLYATAQTRVRVSGLKVFKNLVCTLFHCNFVKIRVYVESFPL